MTEEETIAVFVERADGTRETLRAPISYPEPGHVTVHLADLEIGSGDRYRVAGDEDWRLGGMDDPFARPEYE